jgi:predicted dehydrogenase
MVEAARKSGKLLQIGHQRRSNPRYIHCFEKIIKEAKLLGRITTINAQWNRSARPDDGWPEKTDIDQATLNKYGFKSMHQFRNWRWYKGLGGGPIVDLGSHQIDIFNWFLRANPKSVIASGGTDYYDKKTHEWYDTVMAIFEYEYEYDPAKKQTVRAFYQTITTNSSNGYFETFMGDEGTLLISESAGKGNIYREPSAPDWEKWVKAGLLNAPAGQETSHAGVAVDVRETIAPPAYELPVKMEKKYHQPHLENFFDAIRGKAKLNCPPEVAYESAVTVLKVNEAVEAARKLGFKPEEFRV